MGMLPSFIRLFTELHREYAFRGPMCSLGNQDIWATQDEVSRYAAESGWQARPTPFARHASRTFDSAPSLAALARDFVHARTMFGMFGIEDYVSLDKFDSDRPDLLHDLNLPVAPELHDRFSFVFDGGTAEHIFDVRQVLDNIARMVRTGGCVLHIATFHLDHGLYSFSPSLFYDYYAVNGFGEPRCLLLEVDYRDILRTYRRRHRCIEYRYGMELDGVLDTALDVLVFFVARKLRDVVPPAVPTQGIYLRRGNLSEESPEPPRRSLLDRIPRWLRPFAGYGKPLARPAYQALLRRRRRRQSAARYI